MRTFGLAIMMGALAFATGLASSRVFAEPSEAAKAAEAPVATTIDKAPPVATGLTRKVLIFEKDKPRARALVVTRAKQPSAVSGTPILLGDSTKDESGQTILNEKAMILNEAPLNNMNLK